MGQETSQEARRGAGPVARDRSWAGRRANYFTARGAWNREQTVRRALRSLERRGLVTLDRYVFSFHGDDWCCLEPDRHIPGDTRIMTGALLTEAGWAVVRAAVAAPQERAG